MNDGVAMLLERMKTNPEEFDGTTLSTKWGQLIRLYENYLEPEDRKALSAGVNKVMQQSFTQKVMEELISPRKNTITLTSPSHSIGNTIWNGGAATGTITIPTPIAGVTQTV